MNSFSSASRASSRRRPGRVCDDDEGGECPDPERELETFPAQGGDHEDGQEQRWANAHNLRGGAASRPLGRGTIADGPDRLDRIGEEAEAAEKFGTGPFAVAAQLTQEVT